MRPLVLKNLSPIELPLPDGRYLVIAGLHKIPPHVALIDSGSYFAFTVKGTEHHSDANRLINRLIKKGTAVLLVKIKSSQTPIDPAPFFNHLGILNEGNSCLDPILELLKEELNIIPEQPFLHGLLEELQKLNFIEEVFIHEVSLTGDFELQRYDRAAINQRIRELRKA
jgi:hypothetical protein